MAKVWKINPNYPDSLDEELHHFPKIIRQIAWNRGLHTKDALDCFMNPSYSNDVKDPLLFQDMKKVLERLEKARDAKEQVTIFADYDADGICGAAILSKAFERIGVIFNAYLPHRQDEGYGLNRKAIENLASEGTKVLITIDCGISNADEIAYANDLGIDVIVTDHHEELSKRPPAYAILHPSLQGETYPDKKLCGGGVAFKLAQALIQKYQDIFLDGFDKWLLDLAAISTIADYGELSGENRSLVKYGLIVIQKSRNMGLLELLNISGLLNKDSIAALDIAMKIVPLINAAGRMNHANTAYKLLISNDSDEARLLAEQLKNENVLRQQKTEEIYNAAYKQVLNSPESILIAKDSSWPITLLGIVATRLMNEFGKPVAIIGKKKGLWAGSARSLPLFHIADSLKKLSEHLESYGGHPQAAGFTLKAEVSINDFISSWQEVARSSINSKELVPTIDVECKVILNDITPDLVDWLEKLKPFGQGNPKSRFLLEDVILKNVAAMGKNGNHLRLMVGKPDGEGYVKFVFFNGVSSWDEALKPGMAFDAVIELDYNVWQGYSEVQVKVIDIKINSKVSARGGSASG